MNKPMSDEEFVRTNANRCPYCRSDQISYLGYFEENAQKVECLEDDCGKIWWELFELIGYEGE